MAWILVTGYGLQSLCSMFAHAASPSPDCIGKLAATELLLLTMLHCDSSPHQHLDWRPEQISSLGCPHLAMINGETIKTRTRTRQNRHVQENERHNRYVNLYFCDVSTLPPRTSAWGWECRWSSCGRAWSCWRGGDRWLAGSWRSWRSWAAARPAPASRTDPAAPSTCSSGSAPGQ